LEGLRQRLEEMYFSVSEDLSLTEEMQDKKLIDLMD
jgi:hypothetical protein